MPGLEVSNLEKALNDLAAAAAGRKTVWGTPVPWSARPLKIEGYDIAPEYGAANRITVCSYKVPRGHTALICGVVLGYAGAAGSALPGQVLYTIDVNNPSPVVVANAEGYSEKDFESVGLSKGSLPNGPWPVEFRHDQNETIRVKAETVSGVDTGAGNFVYAVLVGWEWPSMGWEQ